MNDLVELIKARNHQLLEEKISINPSLAHAKTAQGLSLLQYAAYYRNQEAIDIIKRYKGELDIFEAATIGDLEVLKGKLATHPGQMNDFSSDGFTLLGLASYFGHVVVIRSLLDMGADADLASRNGMRVTPLNSASAASNFEIAEMLLKKGVDVNARQHGGYTSLHSAAHNGQTKLVGLLLAYGANIQAKTDDGKTPLDLAIEKGHEETAQLLRDRVAK